MFCQDHYSKTKTVIFIWSKLFLAASLRTGTSLPFHVQMWKAWGSETARTPHTEQRRHRCQQIWNWLGQTTWKMFGCSDGLQSSLQECSNCMSNINLSNWMCVRVSAEPSDDVGRHRVGWDQRIYELCLNFIWSRICSVFSLFYTFSALISVKQYLYIRIYCNSL